MQEFVEFTLGGLSDGVIYAAIGLSLVLIWRGTRVLNYAQGGMAMFTSYVALIVINTTGNYWLGFVVALATGLVMGGVLERIVVRPTVGKSPLNAVIVTIGLLILIEGVAGIIYGSKNRSFPTPYSIVGAKIGTFDLGQGASPSAIFAAVSVLAAAGLLALLFRYTSVGLRMRASAFNGTVAQLMGVRVGRITTLGWALAGLIGALAGMLVTPQTFLYPNSMDSIFVLGFTAAVIGGLDSPVGAIIGGLILGVLLNYVTGYVGTNLPELAGLAILILVLMFRPSGLFASTAARQV
jgi:branched-chain amino acid transport system permease protein